MQELTPEKELAALIGITRQCLAQWRSGYTKKQNDTEYHYKPLLKKDVHWIQPGRDVLYTVKGVQAVKEIAGIENH